MKRLPKFLLLLVVTALATAAAADAAYAGFLKGNRFWRGAEPHETTPSFAPQEHEVKWNEDRTKVMPTRGVSVFNSPDSVVKGGRVPHEIHLKTVRADTLKIEPRGGPGHFEIMPREPMSWKDYEAALSQIGVKPLAKKYVPMSRRPSRP